MVSSKRHLNTGARPAQDLSPRKESHDESILSGAKSFGRDGNSGIRRHLRWWQEQQPSNSFNHARLPKKDSNGVSGSIQNSVSQSEDCDSEEVLSVDDVDQEGDIEHTLDIEDQAEDSIIDHTLLRSGDLVFLRGPRIPFAAIVLRTHNKLAQVYSVHGNVLHILSRRAVFRLEAMVSANELAPLLPHVPINVLLGNDQEESGDKETVLPRDVGAPLINKMRRFIELVDECYRKYTSRLDHIWEIMAPTENANVFTLEEIALRVYQKSSMRDISRPMLWALHKTAVQDGRFMLDSRFHRLLPQFFVESDTHHDHHRVVMRWVREYQEDRASDTTSLFDDDSPQKLQKDHPLVAFLGKAQTIVRNSREIRDVDADGQLGMSKIKEPIKVLQSASEIYRFNKNDQKILQCIRDWALTQRIRDTSDASNIGPTVLRALHLYDGLTLKRSAGYLFLQELGVITPWEPLAIYPPTFPLPGHGLDLAFDNLQSLARSSEITVRDSMADLRKDWGDLPVFCIDSHATIEVDDGISWEAGDGNTSWVHIHVANPSAFIDKDSDIARYAAKLSRTLYLVEHRYPMIEPEALAKRCSLAPGSPSITFSAKMDTDGNIHETDITHGYIHNVKRMTPHMIDRHLYDVENDAQDHPTLTVGGNWPFETQPEHQTFTDTDVSILNKLRDLGSARRLKRDSPITFHEGMPLPKVYLGEGHPPLGPFLSSSRRIVGDPIIGLQCRPITATHGSIEASSQFVSDLMLIAGEVAAKWSAARGLPIAYVGTPTDPASISKLQKFEEQIIRPMAKKSAFLPHPILNAFFDLAGPASTSSVPIEHRYLNLPTYCKITSPLRRYSDLFSHWQIDAAVRHEARTGQSLVGNINDEFLPFSHAEAKRALRDHDIANTHCNVAKKRSKQHWIVQWFNRAYNYNQAPIPKDLTAYVPRTDLVKDLSYGIITQLSLPCVFEETPASRAAGGVKEGETWAIEINTVGVYSSTILAKPVRLLEKAAVGLEDWAKYKMEQFGKA